MERKLRVLVVLFNLAVVNGVSSFVMNYFRKLNHSIVQMDFVVYSKVESPYVNEIENAEMQKKFGTDSTFTVWPRTAVWGMR